MEIAIVENVGTDPFKIIFQDEYTTISAWSAGNGVIVKSRTCEYSEGILMNVTESMTFVPGAKLKCQSMEAEDGEYVQIFSIV